LGAPSAAPECLIASLSRKELTRRWIAVCRGMAERLHKFPEAIVELA
jgi:hypothetical protein